ncbi:hypothetical protein EWM64_g8132 [Hericium alpestre]|uniref:Uncharacterized protein n=1 Tax=Hericium alpestre TaxID=135208 RepID=A0A4Y9ZQX9_9AGAM|nr:hypothetical protein EWM64_g8132 [Hericium alpestre]
MSTKWNFTIDDTSPLFNYTPYSDAFGNGLTSGWQTWYTGSGFLKNGGEASSGDSLHLTNLTNASVTLQFYGSGIYLYGRAGSPYSVLLDSQQIQASAQDGDLLFSKTDLQADMHYITLEAQITDPSSQTLGFDRAVIESTLEDHAASPSQQMFDNQNTTFFQYSSGWSTATDPQIPSSSDPRPYHQTSQKDTAVSFSFTNTTTLAINGSINWGHGLYQVVGPSCLSLRAPLTTEQFLDGQGTTFNASSTWLVPDSLIFYRDNLDPGRTHTVNLTNFSDEKMALNYVTLYNTRADVAASSRSSGRGSALLVPPARPRRVKHTKAISGRDILGGKGLVGGPNTTAHPYSTREVEAALWDVEVGRPAPAQPPPPPREAGAPEVGRIVELLAQRIDRPAHGGPASAPPGYR